MRVSLPSSLGLGKYTNTVLLRASVGACCISFFELAPLGIASNLGGGGGMALYMRDETSQGCCCGQIQGQSSAIA